MRTVEAVMMGGLLLLASAAYAKGDRLCPDVHMTATTPDGTEVIWRGVIDEHELWPSTYESWETMCAESGGMKLYEELRNEPGDYAVLYVKSDMGAWDCRQVHALMGSGHEVVSMRCLATDCPCQYEVYDSRAGLLLSLAGESITRPGYRLVIAAFPKGSLGARPGHTWAKTPMVTGFRIGGE